MARTCRRSATGSGAASGVDVPVDIEPSGAVHGKQTAKDLMTKIEQLEMNAQRARLTADMKGLVEKYRAIFEWDVPEVDVALSDRLILEALRQALDDIASGSAAGPCR